jgi:hypothetical protein
MDGNEAVVLEILRVSFGTPTCAQSLSPATRAEAEFEI